MKTSSPPDDDVAMINVLYFLTSYLFLRDYKKIVDNCLFALIENFDAINRFAWDKLLFEITLASSKDGLSRRTPHYWLPDEQPSTAKLEGVDCFANADEKRTKNSAGHASTSGKSVILLTDSSMGQLNISDDDEDFVDPPPRSQKSSPHGQSPIDEAPSTAPKLSK
ncbi:Hypothetical predicted protein [Olea europaea subsp. europaea]|uniref:Uncharacterized protein n=1 Tax=Olea europaea subsp. europaea TaxID=158383 RepID=A0A8S0QT02_OLEEU|nr:Hypothetical predicted protein [Olea europaea subsp. europaea]